MALTPEQIQQRMGYLGGSDVAAVLGLSRFKTPLKIWAEKTGQLLPEDISGQINVRLGNKLEQTVAEFFMEETDKKVHRVNETIYHPKHPFLAANIDRRVVGEEALLECKTASAWVAKEWAGEDIPQEYVIQVLHYLAVTGKKYGYIAVLIGNQDFKWKKIERDEEVIKSMIEKEVNFWNNFVVPKVMPMQISYQDSDTLYRLFPTAEEGSVVELGDDADKLIETRNAMVQDKKSLEAQLDRMENEIKAILKENESGESERYIVTWKNQVRSNVDSKKLAEEFPEIHAKVQKEIALRVLRIKAKK